jgi:hypothetical protein
MNVFNVHQPQSGGGKNQERAAGKIRQRRARQGLARQRAKCPVDTHRQGQDVVVVQVAGLITAYTVL